MATENVAPNPGENTPGAGNPNPNPAPNPAPGPIPARSAEGQPNPGGPNPNPNSNPNPAPQEFRYKEDRGSWVPPHRLTEETGKRTKLETEIAELRQANELNQKRLRIAMGLEVPTKDEAELQEMRDALYRINPKLALLDRLDEEQLQNILDAADSATTATQAQWQRHTNSMLADLAEVAAELLNVDALSEKQVARLHRAFREEARERNAERVRAQKLQDSSYDFKNDFVARYEAGDKKLLQEFAKAFIDEWGIPARRTAVAGVLSRQGRPTPRGERSRQALTTAPPQIDYNDDKAFGAALLKGRQTEDGV